MFISFLDLQTGRTSGGAPWTALAKDPSGIVTLAEGVTIHWTDPSRILHKQLDETWKSVVKAQKVGENREFAFPFVFFQDTVDTAPRKRTDKYENILENERRAKIAKDAAAGVYDLLEVGEDSEEDVGESTSNQKKRPAAARKSGAKKQQSRGRSTKKVTSKELVASSDD